MAKESAEVRAYSDGGIYIGNVGATMPTDATTAIPTSQFAHLGYITTDGISPKFGREEKDIFAWQAQDPVRSLTTGTPKSIEVDLMQNNKRIFTVAMGGGDFVENGGTVTYTPPADSVNKEWAMVVELIDGDFTFLLCYKRVKQVKEVVLKAVRDDAFKFPLEFKVLTPSDNSKPFTVVTNDTNFLETGLAS